MAEMLNKHKAQIEQAAIVAGQGEQLRAMQVRGSKPAWRCGKPLAVLAGSRREARIQPTPRQAWHELCRLPSCDVVFTSFCLNDVPTATFADHHPPSRRHGTRRRRQRTCR